MKNLSEHFTISELTYSYTAVENGLDNSPDETELEALTRLAVNVLEPLRKCLGAPIFITSGFRNSTVNRLVGGVAASQHTKGEAVDCYTPFGAQHLLDVLLESKLSFDQAILYNRKNFLHISYRNLSANRMVVLHK